MDELPEKILVNIFKKCSGEDVRNLSKVCRRFRTEVKKNHTAWKTIENVKLTPIGFHLDITADKVWISKFGNPCERPDLNKEYTKESYHYISTDEFMSSSTALCFAPSELLYLRIQKFDEFSFKIMDHFTFDLPKTAVLLIDFDRVECCGIVFNAFLKITKAHEIHFVGTFNRSFMKNQLLTGLPHLNSIFIGANPAAEKRTQLTDKILVILNENWVKNVPQPTLNNAPLEVNITLPTCIIMEYDFAETLRQFFFHLLKRCKCTVTIYSMTQRSMRNIEKICNGFAAQKHAVIVTSKWQELKKGLNFLELELVNPWRELKFRLLTGKMKRTSFFQINEVQRNVWDANSNMITIIGPELLAPDSSVEDEEEEEDEEDEELHTTLPAPSKSLNEKAIV